MKAAARAAIPRGLRKPNEIQGVVHNQKLKLHSGPEGVAIKIKDGSLPCAAAVDRWQVRRPRCRRAISPPQLPFSSHENLLPRFCAVPFSPGVGGGASLVHAGACEASGVTADEALHRLERGNARFVAGHLSGGTAGVSVARRAGGGSRRCRSQFAIIVGCSDSRVGPEVIFDQRVGDLFVVRTAGEVVDAVALGSIEYAVAHLGSPLIVVLGHERCGAAVSAAVFSTGAKEPGHIATVLKAIEPAVRATKGQAGDPVENAVQAQALDVAAQLQGAGPILKDAVKAGKLRIVAARYDLDSGRVILLPERK